MMRASVANVLGLSVTGLGCLTAMALAACGDDSTSGSGGAGTGTGETAATGVTSTNGVNGTNASSAAVTSTASGASLGCVGDPLPTTAPATITLGGVSKQTSAMGTNPEPMVNIDVFDPGGTQLATTVSGADGTYSVMADTGGVPVDGYLYATKDGLMDTYVYPPSPLAADITNATALMLKTSTFNLVTALLNTTQTPGNGWIGVVVEDCDGNPITGATVTSDPPGHVFYNKSAFPDNTAHATDTDGVAYIFDLPPGDVTVDADVNGVSLREHSIEVRGDVITTTIVGP